MHPALFGGGGDGGGEGGGAKTAKARTLCVYYRHPCVATEPIMFYFCLFFHSFLIFLFTVRSQKLLD